MICHNCASENVKLSSMDSPIVRDQVEVLAVCQDCGAEHEHSIAGADFELIEPGNEGSPVGAGLALPARMKDEGAAEENHEARQ